MTNAIQSAEQARKAFEMRRAGMTYRQIGERLGCSPSSVHKWVSEWMDEYNLQTEEQFQLMRQEQTARLDMALVALWPRVREGDTDAINSMVRIEAQRSKLWGTDKSSVTVGVGTEAGPVVVKVVMGSEE